MKISDELIACYVEGTVTTEERKIVREYLYEHPEEYERILFLMDNDNVDYLYDQSENLGNFELIEKSSFSDIVFSAAAFAPQQSKVFIPKSTLKSNSSDELYDRLSRMNDELNQLI